MPRMNLGVGHHRAEARKSSGTIAETYIGWKLNAAIEHFYHRRAEFGGSASGRLLYITKCAKCRAAAQ